MDRVLINLFLQYSYMYLYIYNMKNDTTVSPGLSVDRATCWTQRHPHRSMVMPVTILPSLPGTDPTPARTNQQYIIIKVSIYVYTYVLSMVKCENQKR